VSVTHKKKKKKKQKKEKKKKKKEAGGKKDKNQKLYKCNFQRGKDRPGFRWGSKQSRLEKNKAQGKCIHI